MDWPVCSGRPGPTRSRCRWPARARSTWSRCRTGANCPWRRDRTTPPSGLATAPGSGVSPPACRNPARPVASRAVTAPLIPGAQPWSHRGGSHGVLVLHGFTGNPQSMRPLAEAAAAAGFTVEMPLLPGHGTAIEDMVPTRFEDWSLAAESAYHDMAARCDKVIVSGLSMGGTLACWLAVRHPEIAGIGLPSDPTSNWLISGQPMVASVIP